MSLTGGGLVRCPKCNGLLEFRTDHSIEGKFREFRCVNCGYRLGRRLSAPARDGKHGPFHRKIFTLVNLLKGWQEDKLTSARR